MILLIENYKCNNKEELTQREQYWMNTLRPSLNKNAAWVKPKDICDICGETVQCLIAHKDTPRHIEKEMRLLYDFFPEHVEQDIKQLDADDRNEKYGTPKRRYMTEWARGVERGFTTGEPLFEFDDSEYVLIRDFSGVECNRFIGNYYDKQRLGMVDRVFD